MNHTKFMKRESAQWIRTLDAGVSDVLKYHGIEIPEDILCLRVFDLLNLYKIDVGRADAIVTSLYSFLNPNDIVDEAMRYGEIAQPFSYQQWNRAHRKMDHVKVQDLVLAQTDMDTSPNVPSMVL